MKMHTVSELQPYALRIDGQLLRRQRELLLKISDLAHRKQPYQPARDDETLLEGLIGLTDAIADQAHDQHGIDCLLDDAASTRRGREKPGSL